MAELNELATEEKRYSALDELAGGKAPRIDNILNELLKANKVSSFLICTNYSYLARGRDPTRHERSQDHHPI